MDRDLFGLSFPQLLEWRADQDPRAVAFRERRTTGWTDWTWQQVRQAAISVGLALRKRGLGPGECVAIMTRPRVEGLIAMLAAQGIGALPAMVYATTPSETMPVVLDRTTARFFVAEMPEYLDRLPEHAVPDMTLILLGGDATNEDHGATRWEELVAEGDAEQVGGRALWSELVAASSPDEASAVYFTSGTTGPPKAAMLSSRNVLCSYFAPFGMSHGQLSPPGREDRTFHEIPLGSVAGPVLALYHPLLYGCVAWIPQPDDIPRALREASPTVYIAFPRTWEVWAAEILAEIEARGRLYRLAYRLVMLLRARSQELASRNGWQARFLGGLSRVGHRYLVRPLLERRGCADARYVFSGGAPLSPALVRQWQMWGLAIRQIYGMTESGGLATMETATPPRAGIAGRPVPGMELRLADDGEVLVRGPGVFVGYRNQPEVTAEIVDADGWLHTGDIGEVLADGSLRVVDRKSDILVLENGEAVPGAEIEHVLKRSRYIRNAIVVGAGRRTLVALLELDDLATGEWARRNGLGARSYAELASEPGVGALIDGELSVANEVLRSEGKHRVVAVRILPKELDPNDPTELTATRKVRRRQLTEKYQHLVDEMYRSCSTEGERQVLQ